MKQIIFIILFIFGTVLIYSQSVEDYFIDSAHQYVNSKTGEAMRIVDEGLSKYPKSQKLISLKKKIQEQMEQNKGDSDKDGENNDDGSQNQDENQNQQKSEQQDGRNQGEEGTGNSDDQARNQQQDGENEGNPNNGKSFQEQRYDNVLKALKEQEQNTQRRLMMGKSKSHSGRKQRDW